jgi:hypothetical protein
LAGAHFIFPQIKLQIASTEQKELLIIITEIWELSEIA